MIAWFERHSQLSWLVSFIIGAGIFYMSSLTFGSGAPGTSLYSIIYHISVFFLLAFFLFISLVQGKYKKYIPIVVVMVILYGISDEIHQYFVPGRAMTLQDVMLDSIGAISALLVYSIRLKWKRRFVLL